MEELQKQADELATALADAVKRLNITGLEKQLAELNLQIADPKLWDNQARAQLLTKQQAALTTRIQPWRKLEQSVRDLQELIATHDASLEPDLTKQLLETKQLFDE